MLKLLSGGELLVGRGVEAKSLKVGTLGLRACIDGGRAIWRWRRRRDVLGVFNRVIEHVRWCGENSGESGARRCNLVLGIQFQQLRLGEIGRGNIEIEVALERAFGQCGGEALDIAPCRNCCVCYIE